MKRKRRLSQQEILWVEDVITTLCRHQSVSPFDEEYHAAAWLAFQELYQAHGPVCGDDFWQHAYTHIADVIHCEKQIRNCYLYRLVSLDAPLNSETEETLLNMLPSRGGDFTNGTAFRDFLARLPAECFQLARRLMDRDTLEEARSLLGWNADQLCRTLQRLRNEVSVYETS